MSDHVAELLTSKFGPKEPEVEAPPCTCGICMPKKIPADMPPAPSRADMPPGWQPKPPPSVPLSVVFPKVIPGHLLALAPEGWYAENEGYTVGWTNPPRA